MVVFVYFQPLYERERSTIEGGGGGAVHKNKANTIDIGVQSGVMEVVENYSHIQPSRRYVAGHPPR